jgi:hypothetical protein
MDDEEYTAWAEANANVYSRTDRAPDPCFDCIRSFAAEMTALGRCDGVPGGRPEHAYVPMPRSERNRLAAKARREAKEANIRRAVELWERGLLHKQIAVEMQASVTSVGKWLKAWRTAA